MTWLLQPSSPLGGTWCRISIYFHCGQLNDWNLFEKWGVSVCRRAGSIDSFGFGQLAAKFLGWSCWANVIGFFLLKIFRVPVRKKNKITEDVGRRWWTIWVLHRCYRSISVCSGLWYFVLATAHFGRQCDHHNRLNGQNQPPTDLSQKKNDPQEKVGTAATSQ